MSFAMKATITLLAIVCILTIVFAQNSDQANLIAAGRRLSPIETMYYLKMASKYSRYTVPPTERPALFLVPERAFIDEICGEGVASEECDIWGVTDSLPPFAVYVRERDPHNPHTVADTFVHETTHWLQMINHQWPDEHNDCARRSAGEAEAYAAAYLYAVQEEELDAPFDVAQTWMICKMTHTERGHH